MVGMGDLYYRQIGATASLGEPEDWDKAMGWYRKAAAVGDAQAMFKIGRAYRRAYTANPYKDYAKSLKWYFKAADAGNATAMYAIGQHYANLGGENLTQYYPQAMEWFHKAAAAGLGRAMLKVGLYYLKGRFGVSQNYAKAKQWFKKTELHGSVKTAQLAKQELAVIAGLGY